MHAPNIAATGNSADTLERIIREQSKMQADPAASLNTLRINQSIIHHLIEAHKWMEVLESVRNPYPAPPLMEGKHGVRQADLSATE